MKKTILIISLLICSITFSQNNNFFDYGAVVGFNYGSNGDFSNELTSSNLSSKNKSGYHVGVYLNFDFKKFTLRPEVLYTKTKSSYGSSEFDVSKIDIPVNYGIKIVKPLTFFFGPSFQYSLDTDLENLDTSEIDIENDFAVNGQAGLALQLGKQIRLDARYEIGISKNIATIRNGDTKIGEIDTKPNQLILSISLQL